MLFVVRLIGKLMNQMPKKGIKGMAGFFFLLLYHISRYRRKVVRDNLKNAFPEQPASWHSDTEKAFYRCLAKTMAEILVTPSISKAFLYKRISVKETDCHPCINDKAGGAIMLTGHFFNWEWAGLRTGADCSKPFYVVYMPLKHKGFDRFFRKLRSQFGNEAVQMRHIYRKIINNHESGPVSCFLADQSPRKGKSVHYHDFFGRNVPFYNGAVKMAQKFELPLVFCYPLHYSDGTYIVEMEMLSENPSAEDTGVLLERYVRRMEEIIRRDPANWLWTHKRWKHAK